MFITLPRPLNVTGSELVPHLSSQIATILANNLNIDPIVGGTGATDLNTEVVCGKGWGRVEIGIVARTEGEDAEGAADLRVAEGGGLGFAEGAEVAGAALDGGAGEFVRKRGGLCARAR